MYSDYFKRIFDLTMSFSALIIFSPLLLTIALLVKRKLGSPILFRQKRPGLNEKLFTIYKFRTMTNERDERGELLPDSVRLTPFGKFLRSTSLDELPELLNIIKGDMSIVGPRPQLVRDMVFMTPEQRKRHTLLPGLTGWAQVNGRNKVSWEKKLELDMEYLNEITLFKDIEIIIMTISKVFKGDDVKAEGMETSEDFGDYLLRTGKIDKQEYEKKMAWSEEILNGTRQPNE